MEFEGPKVIKLKRINRAGFFGISAFPKTVTVMGCEIGENGWLTGLTKEEEDYYEKELGLKSGELNKHSKWWGEIFNTEHNIRLDNTKPTNLYLDSNINKIKYKVLLASSKIANSEIEKSKPNTLFFIDDQEAKAKSELKQFNFEFEGMKLITKATVEEKKSFLRLFGKAGLELMTEDILSSTLYSEMKKDPKRFFDIMTDKDANIKGFIRELEEFKLLRRTANKYFHGDDLIAHSTEEAVDYFNDIKNQPVKLMLETSLRKKKKITVN